MKFTPPPFQAGSPIRSAELFIWRERDLEFFQSALWLSQNVNLISERRLGSTSLLLRIANPNNPIQLHSRIQHPEGLICIYMNFQELSTEFTTNEVFNFMGTAVKEKVKQQIDVNFDERHGYGSLREVLHQLDRADLHLSILIDEFDTVLSCHKLGNDFFNNLRGFEAASGNLTFIISSRLGLNKIEDTIRKEDRFASDFYNIFMTHRLRLFTDSEARMLIKRYFQAGRDEHDLSLAKRFEKKLEYELPSIHDVTGFHPYLLQLFLHHLCSRIEQKSWPLGASKDEALHDFSKDVESYFQFLWENSSPREQETIMKIANMKFDMDSDKDFRTISELEDRCLIIRNGTAIRLFSQLFSTWCLRQVDSADSTVRNGSGMRNQIFISYSHRDRDWLDRLKIHLRPLERNHSINVWDDTKILAGSKWKNEIRHALEIAKVAVLLVSPDFLASDFIANHELPSLLTAAEKEGLRIVWIAVRPSLYTKTEIGEFQAANDPSNPLSSLTRSKVDKVLVGIAEEIERAIHA